ncbi:hypothetical protein SDC9_207321 [bioreactor metagenome]|uniref:Uncharacterized protein n=1 Tax=bioreactor metagenome TaxID=1076179 RepID=A0A645J8Y0_9ZZZZ
MDTAFCALPSKMVSTIVFMSMAYLRACLILKSERGVPFASHSGAAEDTATSFAPPAKRLMPRIRIIANNTVFFILSPFPCTLYYKL